MCRVLFWLFLTVFIDGLVQAENIRIPPPQSIEDHRSDYAIDLLTQALNYTPTAVEVTPSQRTYSRSRALEELSVQGGLDVVWTVATQERQQKYRAIPIDIYQSYSGYRVMLIRATEQAYFKGLKTGHHWRSVRFAQVHDWIETSVLRSFGWQVQGVSHYENLFPLLSMARVDAVPRGVLEVSAEAERWALHGIAVEQQWLLRYPAQTYFFVGQHNEQLAQRIRHGLVQMQQNGAFDATFQRYFGRQLAKLNLDQRKVITMPNPWVASKDK